MLAVSRDLSLSITPILGPTQSPTHGQPGSFSDVKRPGREADHSPPSCVDVKNEWSYFSTPPICIYGVDRNPFIFTSFLSETLFSTSIFASNDEDARRSLVDLLCCCPIKITTVIRLKLVRLPSTTFHEKSFDDSDFVEAGK
jgi:hypothetical protein